jgi:hypothetical protein
MKLILSFNKEQMTVLNTALIELPFKIAAPLIQEINAQVQRQFDEAKGDGPTGQETPKDQFSGD